MSKRHWNKRLKEIYNELEMYVDELRQFNDMFRVNNCELADMILDKLELLVKQKAEE